MSLSRFCRRCSQPLPEQLTDGTCPSCGFAFGPAGETPRDLATPKDRDGEFEIGSDPNATRAHVPTTIHQEPAYKKVLPLFPDIPNHTDFEVVGRGGMGTVYRAIQRPTDRTVAVKVINYYSDDSSMRERFIAEVRAHAKINHPGIVPIFEVGDCSHGPYFTMEYRPGGTLAGRLKTGGLDDRESARIVADAADAVHAAHLQGIIHRDIKPSNVLVDPEGRVKVTDFGLAKHEASDDITQNGIIVGTFAYMSPEQASGDIKKITKLSDVYCLGSTLYQLVTGEVAHKSKATQFATVKKILDEPTPVPMRLRRDLCPTLDAIVQKGMAASPAERYESAEQFAKDLRCWIKGEPTLAVPLTRGQKARRFLHRHRAAVAMAILVPFLAVAAFVAKRESDPRRRIERALARGEKVTLVGETGIPRYSEWNFGDAILVESEVQRTASFQTQTESTLILARDPGATSWSLSAEIRHDATAMSDGRIGLFVGLTEPQIVGIEDARRFQAIRLSEFWTSYEIADPSLKPRHGVRVDDHLAFLKLPSEEWSSVNVMKPHPFEPAGTNATWRKIRIDADPSGFRIFWPDAGGELKEAIAVTAEKLDRMVVEHNRVKGMNGWPGNPIPGPGWTPQSPVGIYAFRATVSFRNVTLQPRID